MHRYQIISTESSFEDSLLDAPYELTAIIFARSEEQARSIFFTRHPSCVILSIKEIA